MGAFGESIIYNGSEFSTVTGRKGVSLSYIRPADQTENDHLAVILGETVDPLIISSGYLSDLEFAHQIRRRPKRRDNQKPKRLLCVKFNKFLLAARLWSWIGWPRFGLIQIS